MVQGIVVTLAAVVIVALIIRAALQLQKEAQQRETRKIQLLNTAKSYVRDDCFVAADSSSMIGFSFNDNQIILLCPEASGVFAFGDIASCEVVRDDTSVTQTNRGSQVLGAAVGGVLAGPAGLFVGSLSGSKRAKNRISRLDLKVVVDSQQNQVYVIPFFISQNKQGADSRDARLIKVIGQLDRFHAHVSNAIRKADLSRTSSLPRQIEAGSATLTTQLRELFELKQLGALSENDYEQAKSRLLSASHS